MAFKLPKLTTEIDCGAIGYPGLAVECWLNVTYEEWQAPEAPKAWDTVYYYSLGRILEQVTFPAEFIDNDEPLTVELPDAHAVYDLMQSDGFDQSIIVWAVDQYTTQRQQRLEVEVKN